MMTTHTTDVVQTPLVTVRDLRLHYTTARGPVEALRGTDLEVWPGESVALVGESGSGKSTLSHALIGLLPESAQRAAGTIHYRDTDITHWQDHQLRHLRGSKIGLIPQDPTVSLNPVHTIGQQLVEAIRASQKMSKSAARTTALELLDQAGLDRPAARFRQYPHQLSGGMRQRVLISLAIAGEPELLIADEPTSALDATVQKRILDHLQHLTQTRGIALLLVTHDLAVAAERTDRMVVMHHGRIVEAGDTDTLLADPKDDYTRRLLASAPVFQSDRPTSEPLPEQTPVLLEVTQLRKEFRLHGGRGAKAQRIAAVDGVSFQLRQGETLGLVGESGSGKSTTARLVLGLEKPSSGTVTFAGTDITGLKPKAWRALRRRIQLIYQNPYASLDPRFTIEDLVTEPLDAFSIGTRAERRRKAQELLARVALPEHFLQRKPAELSGGQRQRVAIARALTLSPDIVVCDEPVSALDVSVQAQVLQLLGELQRDHGLTYLFITHDLAVVRQLAHRVAVMQTGRIVELGDTRQVFENPQHDYTKQLLSAISGAGLSNTHLTPKPVEVHP
jgi:peptide/nickel transport system ATP-binding protein